MLLMVFDYFYHDILNYYFLIYLSIQYLLYYFYLYYDAKYYRYGDSKDPTELPRSTSINKQITYGEYVATDPKFKDENGHAPPVYNVFLMPFNKNGASTALQWKPKSS